MEMVYYRSHKEIPTKYRKVILDEVFEKRVSKVPLDLCNRIIEDHLHEQMELETLKDFEVRAVKNLEMVSGNFKSLQEAEVFMDQIIDYGDDLSPTMVLLQAKKPIRAFIKGQWNFLLPKDRLIIKKRVV